MSDSPFTLVVGAAPTPGGATFYADLLRDAAYVVAADGAAEWCAALGRRADVAIGDFDSALPGAVERLTAADTEVLRYPCDKDETDLDLAVEAALLRSRRPLVLTAAFTERLDHTLGAIGSLLRAGDGASIREPGWTGHAVTPDHPQELSVDRDLSFSILALGAARGVTVSGAKWNLSDADLDPLSGRGVSNVTSGEILRVSVGEGTLIVLIRTASGHRYTR